MTKNPYMDTRPAWAVFLFVLGLILLNAHLDAIEPQTNPGADGYARSRLLTKADQSHVDQQLAELEEAIRAGRLELFYRTATDSVTGGRILSVTQEVSTSSVVYPALSATAYTQVNTPDRISEAAVPGVATLPMGLITSTRYMSSDQTISTGRSVTGLNELWSVDADGSSNPTFIASSSEYVVLGVEVQRIEADYSLAADTSMGGADPTTRRFLEKHYRKRTGVVLGADPIITVYYGGIYEGFMSFGLDSAVVMKTDGTNAAAVVALPGALKVAGTTELNGVASAVKVLGNPAAPVTSTDGKGGLDIWNRTLILGANDATNIRGDGNVKFAALVCPHVTNAEQPHSVFTMTNSTSGNNFLSFGGGNSAFNAYEVIRFFTAPNVTTLTGIERARFSKEGYFGLATSTPQVQLHSVGDARIDGNASISANLDVGGIASIGSALNVTGQTTMGNASATDLQVSSRVAFNGRALSSTFPMRSAGNYEINGGHIYFSDGYGLRFGDSGAQLYASGGTSSRIYAKADAIGVATTSVVAGYALSVGTTIATGGAYIMGDIKGASTLTIADTASFGGAVRTGDQDIYGADTHRTSLLSTARIYRIPVYITLPETASGVATLAWTITTTNETGDTDAGVYTCKFSGIVGNTAASNNAGDLSGIYFSSAFTRALDATGALGSNGAVSELAETDSGMGGSSGRTTLGATMTTSEASEYATDVLIEVLCGGASSAAPVIYGEIEIISTFKTAPTVTLRP